MWEDEDGVDDYTKVNDNFGDQFLCDYMRFDLGETTNKIREEDRVNPYTRRNDPILVKVIEELGEEANGDGCSIRIIEIPDDMHWRIGEKYRDSDSFDFSDTLTIW